MHKWRDKHPDHPHYNKAAEKSPPDTGSRPDDERLTDDAAVAGNADDIYAVAAGHRETVKAKDAAAKARRKKGTRRVD